MESVSPATTIKVEHEEEAAAATAEVEDDLLLLRRLCQTCDPSVLLQAAADRLYDRFSLWDLALYKAKMKADSKGVMGSIMDDTEAFLAELKLLIEACLRPVKPLGYQRKKRDKLLEEDSIEVDTMLGQALSIQAGLWKAKDFAEIDYRSDILNVASLFPKQRKEEEHQREQEQENQVQDPIDEDTVMEDDLVDEAEIVESSEAPTPPEVKPKKKPVAADKPYECEKCGRAYNSSTALYNHKEKVCAVKIEAKFKESEEGKFYCAYSGCPRADNGFSSKQTLEIHWANAHIERKNKIIPCVLCDRRFATSEAKKEHMARDHTKKHRCNFCEAKFLTETHLKKHMLEHKDVAAVLKQKRKEEKNAKTYLCLKCGQAMSHEYGRKHEANCNGQRVRRPEYKVVNEEFFCTVQGCKLGFGFNSMYGLRKHFHDKHIREDEKYFQCEYCEQKFSFLTTKNKHVKAIHIKSYVCDLCGKGFGSKAKVDKHRLTHTGEKPHACDQCDYRAAIKYNLDVHRATKHGLVEQKNYLCTLCNKQFTTMGRVHRHMTVAHGDDSESTNVTPATKRRRNKTMPLPPYLQQQIGGQQQQQQPQPQTTTKSSKRTRKHHQQQQQQQQQQPVPMQQQIAAVEQQQKPQTATGALTYVQQPQPPHYSISQAPAGSMQQEQEVAVQYLQQQLEGPHGTVITVTPLYQQ